MIKFTKKEWEKNQYKDIYMDYDGTRPDLKGKRTTLQLTDKGTVLIIESVHFEITK